MSAAEIFSWWFFWLGVGGCIVLAAAALLLAILALARRISALAAVALGVVEAIEQNTKPIWQLRTTGKVAGELLVAARSIERNAGEIVGALQAPEQRDTA